MRLSLSLIGLCALALVSAEYYTTKTADKEYLQKQKKIYNLLYHVAQPDLVTPEMYEEGKAYNIEANIDSYTNTAAVKEFLSMYENGMLPRGELFSFFYPRQLKQFTALFRLFYYAKDFDVFYKTALWARIYMNEGQFVLALYNAVIQRPDTAYLQMPPPYEMYPYAFFNSEVLEKAHHAKLLGKLDTKKTFGMDSYIIPANYSGWYLSREYDTENKLNYFVEDIGLNTYYFYFRQEFPFYLSSKEFNFPSYRGEEYLYGHKQLLARYYLERFSNDLGKVEDFDWTREFYAGYYPTMTFHNGLPYPQRPSWSKFPHYKFKYIKDIQDMETRVAAAIDVGHVRDADGKLQSIFTPEGMNILGNMIEGNMDSCNIDYYGSIDQFARKILGYNLDSASPYQIVPSALESFTTSMRDPAFYRLYKRIFYYYYYRYKMQQKSYTKDEIVYPSIKIESFVPDKLITYFDYFDTTISNGLMVESQKEAESNLIKVRQYRLNHKPFSFHLTINSDRAMKAAVRIFIGPKYDTHHKQMDLYDSLKYFYEIDNWILDLNAGVNKIVRKSEECFFVMPDPEPSEMFYRRVTKALEGTENLTYNERIYGFPERLLLPRGKKEGMPFRIYVHVSPVNQEYDYTSRVFGSYKFDGRSFGYPLDRPMENFDYEAPNMMFKDILIYHKDDLDVAITY